MIICNRWPLGLCSWSVGKKVADIADVMAKLGLSHVHLALAPAVGKNRQAYLADVRKQPWTITSTMIDFPQEDYSTVDSIRITGGIVPDYCWEKNQQRVTEAIRITAQLQVKYLSFHFGFIDNNDREYFDRVSQRTKILADIAGEHGVTLLMETGQETAQELKEFLERMGHPALGVNFDPANTILYDKDDPVEAVAVLAPWIKHIHIKDAMRKWDAEVPWGSGQVDHVAFLTALEKIKFDGPLAIEREAGKNRFEDIKQAVEKLAAFSN